MSVAAGLPVTDQTYGDKVAYHAQLRVEMAKAGKKFKAA